jgi:gentisate 1,2-dioxygenase
VVSGRGHSIIEGRRYDWSKGDYFALPHRAWHEHVNGSPSEPAVLFSLPDEPALEAMALLRKQPLDRNGVAYQTLS